MERLIRLPAGNQQIKIEPVRDEQEERKKESIRDSWPTPANLRRIYDDFLIGFEFSTIVLFAHAGDQPVTPTFIACSSIRFSISVD